MPGNEPIRFGLMGYGKNYRMEVRDFERFAKEGIKLDELKKLLEDNNIKIKDEGLFDKMFASIAKDDVLDVNELFGYFKKLDNAAELNTKNLTFSENDLLRIPGEKLGDILQADELQRMENARGNVGKKPNVEQTETMFQFVSALIKVNDAKVAKETELEAKKAAEEADLASRTTVDPKTGNKTVRDKDDPNSAVVYNADGKKIKEIEEYYYRYTTNFDPETGLKKNETKYDKENKKVTETTNYYYEGETLVRSVTNDDRGTRTVKTYRDGYEYDVEKTVITGTLNNGNKYITTIHGDENDPDGTAYITYKDSEGKKIIGTSTETYRDGALVKQVNKDAEGNVTQTTTNTYYTNEYDELDQYHKKSEKVVDGQGNVLKEVKWGKDDNITYSYEKGITTNVVKNGNETVTTKTKDDGTVISEMIVRKLDDGTEETIYKDGDGNVTQRITFGPGELPGQTIKTVYNSNDEFVESVADRMLDDGSYETVRTLADGRVNIEITDWDKFRREGCSEPYKIQKDAKGNVLVEEFRTAEHVYVDKYYLQDGNVHLTVVAEYDEASDRSNHKFTYHNRLNNTDTEIDREEFKRILKGLDLYYSGLDFFRH